MELGTLGDDLLRNILTKLPFNDRIFTAPCVCRQWMRVARQPQCFREIDTREWAERQGLLLHDTRWRKPLIIGGRSIPGRADAMLKKLGELSRGQVETLILQYCTTKGMMAVCAGQTNLKRLELWSVFGSLNQRRIDHLLRSCPQLEHLKIGDITLPDSFRQGEREERQGDEGSAESDPVGDDEEERGKGVEVVSDVGDDEEEDLVTVFSVFSRWLSPPGRPRGAVYSIPPPPPPATDDEDEDDDGSSYSSSSSSSSGEEEQAGRQMRGGNEQEEGGQGDNGVDPVATTTAAAAAAASGRLKHGNYDIDLSLDYFTAHHTAVGLSVLSIAKRCPNLKTLHLTSARGSDGFLTDTSMTGLVEGCTGLTDLSLIGSRYDEQECSAIRALSGCQQLRNLSLCSLPLLAFDALQDGSCPLLSSLSLTSGDEWGNIDIWHSYFRCTARPQLTSLCAIDSVYFGDSQLEAAVTECFGLTKLDVSGTRVSDWGIAAAVRNCSHLRILSASRCRYVTDESVRVVAAEAGRQLRELCFDETSVTHNALSSLAGTGMGTNTPGLVKLLLYGTLVGGGGGGRAGGERLSALPSLESLRSLEVILERHPHLEEMALRIFDPLVDVQQAECMEFMWAQAVAAPKDALSEVLSTRLSGALPERGGLRSSNMRNDCLFGCEYGIDWEPRLPAWQCCGPFLRCLSAVGRSLRSLHLYCDPRALFGDFEEGFLVFLSSCPNLVSLRLTGFAQVTDTIVYKLGDLCPSLEHLAIAGSRIPFWKGIEHLAVTSPRPKSFEYRPDHYKDVLLDEAYYQVTHVRRGSY
ncbi:hypothetical protein CBR_g31808 [Chara braunii]|uniref:F-box domain-containing protein n=1 Tax=Chara braunii TaxID=69332 RepID=A0A388LG21_CHABU|nr:hypothetical protein CBR_g31808 [Chara braunii]|eukprot:GBG81132.1 hypothetical protein CBR_g31808 [Chara braunii]